MANFSEAGYVVVEYLDEQGGMYVIPHLWIRGSEAYWPPYQKDEQVRYAARTMEVPCNNWNLFPMKEWARNGDWEAANALLVRLKDSSNVESAGERGRSRRKNKRKRRDSSSSVEHVIKKKKKQKPKQRSSCSSRSFRPPTPPRLFTSNSACRIFSSLDSDEECTSSDAMHLNERPPASEARNELASSHDFLSSTTIASTSVQEENRSVELHHSNMESVLEKIFRGIEELKSEMKSLRKVTEGLKNSERKTSDNAVAGLFPFQTEENLRSFERSCLNEKFRDAVITYLLAFNGRSSSEATRNILTHTMSNTLALSYNLGGKGASGRKGFQSLHFYKLIFAAVRRLYPNENERDYRRSIVNWLDGAKDRDGGRKSRRKIEVAEVVES